MLPILIIWGQHTFYSKIAGGGMIDLLY